jgi:hypothetical protein
VTKVCEENHSSSQQQKVDLVYLSGKPDHEACAMIAFERRGEGSEHKQITLK